MAGKSWDDVEKKVRKTKKTAAGDADAGSSTVTSPRITGLRSEITKELYKEIEFSFYAPLAKEVRLAGSFTEWKRKAIKMNSSHTGNWQTKIRLKPGRHEYKFLIDGNWENDQKPCELVGDGHGGCNCVITVH